MTIATTSVYSMEKPLFWIVLSVLVTIINVVIVGVFSNSLSDENCFPNKPIIFITTIVYGLLINVFIRKVKMMMDDMEERIKENIEKIDQLKYIRTILL